MTPAHKPLDLHLARQGDPEAARRLRERRERAKQRARERMGRDLDRALRVLEEGRWPWEEGA